jgi:hypothetical protein
MDQPDDRQSLKRKRSPELDHGGSPAGASKTPKTSNHLAINYLARQRTDDIPLVAIDDTLPNLIQSLGEYAGILDRHESMAFNLGAKPLGPILVRRFEKLFDGPPKLLRNHGKDGTTVSWLDVVEFARNKPEQFTLAQMSEGVRVCQFYTKQCRVQISEEDFALISSGMPQKLIPPQPIIEDEEKELGTLEILEQTLGGIVQMADQGKFWLCCCLYKHLSHTLIAVAAKGRQLRHRIVARKQAILDRRASDPTATTIRASSPSNIALMNGNGTPIPSGFIAVNSKPTTEGNGTLIEVSKTGASETTRNELLEQFAAVKHLKMMASLDGFNGGKASQSGSHGRTVSGTPIGKADEPQPLNSATASPNPQMYPTPLPVTQKDNDGPYKAEMVARVESIPRGQRIIPPCDRCRRLHMDCVRNLTACLGCTKKHAKCSWKEVRAHELTTPITTSPGVSEEADPSLEYLQRATRDTTNESHLSRHESNDAGSAHHDASTRAMAMNAAAAALAAVPKASASILDSSEADLQQVRAATEHHVQMAQSPNLVPPPIHQSPNISNYGSFSPPHPSHSSVNMPYASGRRISSPIASLQGTEEQGNNELKYDVQGLDKETMDIRSGDGLLAS